MILMCHMSESHMILFTLKSFICFRACAILMCHVSWLTAHDWWFCLPLNPGVYSVRPIEKSIDEIVRAKLIFDFLWVDKSRKHSGVTSAARWCNISKKMSETATVGSLCSCRDAGSKQDAYGHCEPQEHQDVAGHVLSISVASAEASSDVLAEPSSSPIDQILPETERRC